MNMSFSSQISQMKEYLFLDWKPSQKESSYIKNLATYCQEFKQIHIHCYPFAKNEINSWLCELRKSSNHHEIYMYCFTKEQYSYCLEQGLMAHICWYNGQLEEQTWVDEVIQNKKKQGVLTKWVNEHEFFWMLGQKYVTHLFKRDFHANLENSTQNQSPIFDIVEKLKAYNIPLCLNASRIFNENNENFTQIHDLIKNIHQYFKNPLYLKEKDNVALAQGNYYLKFNGESLNFKTMLMGFYGDIIIDEKDAINKINLQQIHKSKDCMNCSVFENCNENHIGVFMNNYGLNRCWGPKLMMINQSL